MDGTSASGRFFAVYELVSHFLHQADADVLINCQRVCRFWNEIIEQTDTLQQNLFFVPLSADTDTTFDGSVTLNPIMTAYFAPLLGPLEQICTSTDQYVLQSSPCRYSDLEALPWAKDGTSEHAHARQAFARKEASWRRMLVTQPPIKALDWWHEWESANRQTEPRSSHLPVRAGTGHEQTLGYYYITLGMLWDILEPRLLRGCSAQVSFFVAAVSPDDDPTAGDAERMWFRKPRHPKQGSRAIVPRIRVRSQHVWPGDGPSVYQKFNVDTCSWECQDEWPLGPLPRKFQNWLPRNGDSPRHGDGVRWLVRDCMHDDEEGSGRRSMSDGFRYEMMRLCRSFFRGPRRP